MQLRTTSPWETVPECKGIVHYLKKLTYLSLHNWSSGAQYHLENIMSCMHLAFFICFASLSPVRWDASFLLGITGTRPWSIRLQGYFIFLRIFFQSVNTSMQKNSLLKSSHPASATLCSKFMSHCCWRVVGVLFGVRSLKPCWFRPPAFSVHEFLHNNAYMSRAHRPNI